jgi:hypothetical protein
MNIRTRTENLPQPAEAQPNVSGTGRTQGCPIDVGSPNRAESTVSVVSAGRKGLQTVTVDDPRKPFCPGILIKLPSGVSPYSTYPFKLHDIFSLSWDIRSSNPRLWLASTNCTGEVTGDACRPCRELLLNEIVVGILERIENGVHETTPLAYRSIEALI